VFKLREIATEIKYRKGDEIAKAKSIALSQVPGANESHLGEIDLDREHGRMVYEIEIFYNNSKYEYDIDAVTGEIVGSKIKKYNNWN